MTAEGRAARNRRGIALVVHGAPLSGKTATAVSLAKMYGAALLTVDGVVIEAISNGNTSAGKDRVMYTNNRVKFKVIFDGGNQNLTKGIRKFS